MAARRNFGCTWHRTRAASAGSSRAGFSARAKINSAALINLYKACDVVCLPSRNEPFGISALEGWAAGKPVVASQVGGPSEFIWHNVTGLKIYPTAESVGWGLGTLFTFARLFRHSSSHPLPRSMFVSPFTTDQNPHSPMPQTLNSPIRFGWDLSPFMALPSFVLRRWAAASFVCR